MIGIIILNYNTWETTIECVTSIQETNVIKNRIYIVDNNSLNNSYESLCNAYSQHNDVEIIKSTENGGFAKGNNIGIREAMKAGCDYIVVVNNDVIFKKNSINEMLLALKNNENAVIVGPKIISPEGITQKSITNQKQSVLEYIGINSLISSKDNKNNFDSLEINNVEKVYSVSGCCLMINAPKFIEMWAFDENTFLYNEENIYSYQANSNKLDILYIPTAVVIHNHGTTTGKMNLFICTEFIKSGMYYWTKYRKKKFQLLFFIWLIYTSKYAVKSIYMKDMRKGWENYLKETFRCLLQTF